MKNAKTGYAFCHDWKCQDAADRFGPALSHGNPLSTERTIEDLPFYHPTASFALFSQPAQSPEPGHPSRHAFREANRFFDILNGRYPPMCHSANHDGLVDSGLKSSRTLTFCSRRTNLDSRPERLVDTRHTVYRRLVSCALEKHCRRSTSRCIVARDKEKPFASLYQHDVEPIWASLLQPVDLAQISSRLHGYLAPGRFIRRQ